MPKVSSVPEKPLLIYDGECVFCCRWISRWQVFTGQAVQYAPSQQAGAQYPEIDQASFDRSVQLIEPDGQVYGGAEAVFRTLTYAPKKKWLYGLYRRFGFFRRATEWFYALAASHRVFFSQATRFLWGRDLTPGTFHFASWLFIKLVGLTYLIAFTSLSVQIIGLAGSGGILPAGEYLNFVYQQHGPASFYHLPSIFWLSTHDAFLMFICWSGMALSAAVILGFLPALSLFFLWFFYLSLTIAGQEFSSFQWDTLLLETGWLAVFFAPTKRGGLGNFVFRGFTAPSPVRLLFYWLLFRLMYFSGAVKLRSGDFAWSNLLTLNYHYETQPLPTAAAWYAHQLPEWFDKFSVAVMFGIELFIPFLIFAPRRLRHFAGSTLIVFQILILLTGNYCFFNLLTIFLSLLLFDDRSWPKAWAERFVKSLQEGSAPASARGWPRGILKGVVFFVMLVTLDQIPRIVSPKFDGGAGWLSALRRVVQPFRSFNNYGLFSVMTTVRNEIILEGSYNRIVWKEYEFKYKPGDPLRKPPFCAPHQPRLDWQMWFASLTHYRQQAWFIRFCERLLKNAPEVKKLLKADPFPDGPPKYLRAVLYHYRFSDLKTRRETGQWWVRERRGLYLPVLSLKENQ